MVKSVRFKERLEFLDPTVVTDGDGPRIVHNKISGPRNHVAEVSDGKAKELFDLGLAVPASQKLKDDQEKIEIGPGDVGNVTL